MYFTYISDCIIIYELQKVKEWYDEFLQVGYKYTVIRKGKV